MTLVQLKKGSNVITLTARSQTRQLFR